MGVSRRNFFRSFAASALTATTVLPHESAWADALSALGRSQPDEPLHLDESENAYGPSTKVIEAMRLSLSRAHRYPNGECNVLIEKIASQHNVKPEQVTLGAGVTEILRMAVEAFLPAGRMIVVPSPTFPPMVHLAETAGVRVAAVPLNKKYEHDLDAMLAQSNRTTGLVYVCNPNNPTGSLTPRKDLELFLSRLRRTVTVVIDEAYHDYVEPTSDYASFLDRPVDDGRVIVVRTLSKIYGLAGLRLGYAISAPEVSRRLARSKLQWGVNVIAATAAAAALDDVDYVQLSAKRNMDDRQELYNQANARMLRSIDSHTNFVALKTGLPSTVILEHFRKNNILLGPLIPQMDKYTRVSLGTSEEMQEFWRVWDLLPPHPMAM